MSCDKQQDRSEAKSLCFPKEVHIYQTYATGDNLLS